MDFKNLDQSNKSITGHSFNKFITDRLMAYDALYDHFFFVKAEPKFEKTGETRDGYRSEQSLTMDHWCFIVDEKNESILSILIDATTTYRERVKIKAFEGFQQQMLRKEVEKELFRRYPEFNGYKIHHMSMILFPTTLNPKLKKYEYENKAINDFCTFINYGTRNCHTTSYAHFLDVSIRMQDFENALTELLGNQENYTLDRTVIASIWKNQHDDFDHKPERALTVKNIKNYPEQILHNLEHYANRYNLKNDIKPILRELKIAPKGYYSKETGIRLLKDYIKTHILKGN